MVPLPLHIIVYHNRKSFIYSRKGDI